MMPLFLEVAKVGSNSGDGGVADLVWCIWLAKSCWTTGEFFQSATVDIGAVGNCNVGASAFSCKSVVSMLCIGSKVSKVLSTGM